ncbi:MAG: hypothetical protein M1818_000090 [Claussenomyces sp. TS43310]|nr:MAG: hypothetical protein M1818_000090 [Claussenomyces sp. TS43310]
MPALQQRDMDGSAFVFLPDTDPPNKSSGPGRDGGEGEMETSASQTISNISRMTRGASVVDDLLVARTTPPDPLDLPDATLKTAYDDRLRQAAGDGRQRDVIELLQLGANVNSPDSDGETALHLATRSGQEAVVQILVDNHADLEIIDNDGWRALYRAVRKDFLPIVKILLDNGADINATCDKWTPLQCAACFASGQLVEELLKRTDPAAFREAKTNAGETALHIAARSGNLQAVELLLAEPIEIRTNINSIDNDGWTPLFGACVSGMVDVARVLLESDPAADVGTTIGNGDRALNTASRSGHINVVRQLLQYPAVRDAIDLMDGDGWTSLCCATGKGHQNVTQLLIENGANLTAQTGKSGEMALHIAVRLEQQDIIKQLLQYEEVVNRIDLIDNTGDTALYCASGNGQKEAVRLLLEKNADINVRKSENGETALHAASREGFWDVLDLLLRQGTDVHLVDKKGWTILHTAASYGHNSLIELILDRHADMLEIKTTRGETAVHLAATRGNEVGVIALLEKANGPGSGRQDVAPWRTKSWKALHWAAYYGHASVVYWLLVNGASLKEEDDLRRTARQVLDEKIQTYMASSTLREAGKTSLESRRASVPAQKLAGEKPITQREKDQTRPANQKLIEGKRKTSLSSGEEYFVIRDLLCNPPILRGKSELDEPYDIPTLRDPAEEEVCSQFHATIVDFYERGEHIDFLRRSRTVYDVIYGAGPDHIMSNAVKDLELIFRQVDLGSSKEESAKGEPSRDDAKSQFGHERKFRWIHLPANNMAWMKDLVKRIYKDKEPGNKKSYLTLSQFVRDSMYELPGRASRSRLMKPSCRRDTTDDRLVLCMPYLTFARQTLDSTKESACYDKLLEVYNGKMIHGSQTLDEFFYHDLSDRDRTTLDVRDSDQVVTRYIERTPKGPWEGGWTILRVDQLWLWQIDKDTIITSSTHRMDSEEDPVAERIYDYLKQEKGKGQGQPPPPSVYEMSRFITNFCIGFIDQYTTKIKHNKSYKSAKEIFAISVNKQAVKESELFFKFVNEIDQKIRKTRQAGQTGKIDNKASKQDLKDAEEKDQAPEEKHGSGYESISDAAHLLEEVKDIRDELSILKSVLRHQKTVWDILFQPHPGGDDDAGNSDRQWKNDQQRSPDWTIEEIEEMDRSATRIQDSVKTLLDLDQNEANISEAQQTTQQGRTLMFFTVVTIVFLPMSFLASLFALDVTSFPHDQKNLLYEPGWIFPIIFGVSAVISLPLIVLAINANASMDLLKSIQDWNSRMAYFKRADATPAITVNMFCEPDSSDSPATATAKSSLPSLDILSNDTAQHSRNLLRLYSRKQSVNDINTPKSMV